MKKIIFTGGGTLGHCMPNLYLLDSLKDIESVYIGGNGIEKEIATKYAKKYYTIPTVKFHRGKILKNLKIPFVLIKAIGESKKILKQEKPDLIFSKGGYVSLPVCLSAKQLRIPIVAHESDFSFGLANKIILRLCDTMCVNFKNLESKNKKCVHTGAIFDKSYYTTIKNKDGLNLDESKKTILVVCGSQGSVKINENFSKIVKNLLPKYNIIHLTGKGNKYKSFDNYNAMEMCQNMPNLYNIADMVIGRSGAGVTAECYFKKLPMLLIPLENKSSRGDQVLNAKYYQDLGVAKVLREDELTPVMLLDKINSLMDEFEKIKEQYKKLPNENGLEKTLNIIERYLKK